MELAWFKNAPTLPPKNQSPHLSQNRTTTPPPQTPTLRDRPHRQALHRRQAGAARLRLQHGGACGRWTIAGGSSAGNRKDIRNAVEAARKATAWAKATAHNRAQVLYYCARSFPARDEIAHRLADVVGEEQAAAEVELSIGRFFVCGVADNLTARCTILHFEYRDCDERGDWDHGHHLSREAPLLGFFRSRCPRSPWAIQ